MPINPVTWVARGFALGDQVQATAFGRNGRIEHALLGVETLAVKVHAIGQLQAVPLLGKQRLEAGDLEVLLRSGEVHALGTLRFTGVVVGEWIEIVVFLAVRALQVEVLAQQVGVVIVGVEQQALGTRLQVGVVAAADFGVFEVGRRLVVQVGEVDADAAVIARIVVLGQQVQVLHVIELDRQAAHQVQGAVVLQVGLGVVDKHLVALAIVKGFVLFAGNPQATIDPIRAAAD